MLSKGREIGLSAEGIGLSAEELCSVIGLNIEALS